MSEELDPMLAQLIDADRETSAEEEVPVDAMKTRLLLSLAVAGAGVATASTAAAGATSALSVGAKATLKTKILAVAALTTVSAASGALVQKYRDDRRAVVVAAAPAPPSETPTSAPVAEKPAVIRVVERSKDNDLQAERKLIESARTALLRGEPKNADLALATHRKRYAKGRLSEERDSLEVQTLAALDRAEEAKAAAARFLARYPNSFFASAVGATLSR